MFLLSHNLLLLWSFQAEATRSAHNTEIWVYHCTAHPVAKLCWPFCSSLLSLYILRFNWTHAKHRKDVEIHSRYPVPHILHCFPCVSPYLPTHLLFNSNTAVHLTILNSVVYDALKPSQSLWPCLSSGIKPWQQHCFFSFSSPSSQLCPCVILFKWKLAYSYSLDHEQDTTIKFLTPFIFNTFMLIFLKSELNRNA